MRLIAIVRLRRDDAERLVRVCQELLDAGLPAVEVTLTTPGALGAIEKMGGRVGAGSVRSAAQAAAAQTAGAAFLVTPVVKPGLIAASAVPVVCGAFTPTEMEAAWSAGAAFVKLFPASALGPSYVREVLAPMPDLPLIPTGGVSLAQVAEYAAAGAVGVGVGSALINDAEDWMALRRRARTFIEAVEAAWD